MRFVSLSRPLLLVSVIHFPTEIGRQKIKRCVVDLSPQASGPQWCPERGCNAGGLESDAACAATLYWINARRWEGTDLAVTVIADAGIAAAGAPSSYAETPLPVLQESVV